MPLANHIEDAQANRRRAGAALAIKPALGAVTFFFVVAFLSNLQSTTDALLNGVIGALVFGGICSLFARSACKNDTTFIWWQWVPYFTGALIGCMSILYWLVMYWIHKRRDGELPFFNGRFHWRTYKLGLVLFPLFLLVGVLEVLGLV